MNLFQGTAEFAPMTPKEAASYLGFSVATLRKWRETSKGPHYCNYGQRIYYQKHHLDDFLKSVFCPPIPKKFE